LPLVSPLEFAVRRVRFRVFPPGPHGRPLLGSLPDIRRDPLAFLVRIHAEYGEIAHVRLGPFHVFLLNHPDDIEQVLVTHHHRFIKGRSLSGARRLFGNGLLTSDGALHARQRRLVQPVFHRVRLDDYARVMATLGVERRDRWRDGDIIDIAGEMSRLTLAITGRILFGAEGDAVAAEIHDALEAATSLMEIAVLPFAALTDLLPLRPVRRFRASRATLDRVVKDLIERRRRDGTDIGDVVSLLLWARNDTAGEGMSDRQLRDEVITLLLASHETTANALAWTWYLLARHSDVEARLHAEIDTVVGRDHPPQAGDVTDLPFTRMVLAESMRLYPPAWLLARVAVDNHEARGYVVPPGSLVVMSPWVVHRNGMYFPEPEKFDPDRWCADAHNGRPRFSYFPFGGGSRGCMGEAFAWMEGVLLLAVIAQRWRFRLLDESSHPEMHPGLTLTPKSGIRVKVERRV
jgi:cytochrome P450